MARRAFLSATCVAIIAATGALAAPQCGKTATFHVPSACQASEYSSKYKCENAYDILPTPSDVGTSFLIGGTTHAGYSEWAVRGINPGGITFTYASPVTVDSICYDQRDPARDKAHTMDVYVGSDASGPRVARFDLNTNTLLNCYTLPEVLQNVASLHLVLTHTVDPSVAYANLGAGTLLAARCEPSANAEPPLAAPGSGMYLVASLQHDLAVAEQNASVGITREQARADGWTYTYEDGTALFWTLDGCHPWIENTLSFRGDQCGTVRTLQTQLSYTAPSCVEVHTPLQRQTTYMRYAAQQDFPHGLRSYVQAYDSNCRCGDGQVLDVEVSRAALNGGVDATAPRLHKTKIGGCSGAPALNYFSEVADVKASDAVTLGLHRGKHNWCDGSSMKVLVYANCVDKCTSPFCAQEYERSCNRAELPSYSIDTCEASKPTIDLGPMCSCPRLAVDYMNDRIPEATQNATVAIALNQTTLDVVFTVSGVMTIQNGHVIASAIDMRKNVSESFPALVEAFDYEQLWTQPTCELNAMDTPAPSLGITTHYDAATCQKTFEMRYSLTDSVRQDKRHCSLTDDGTDIKVQCSITISSVRAYDGTEKWAGTAHETTFAAEMTIDKQVSAEVADLLQASLAKCSVKNGPLYVVDCRVPGNYSFEPTFTLVQQPAGWIVAEQCAATVVNAATYIRCPLNSNAPIANIEVARANLTAQIRKSAGQGSGSGLDAMTFDIEYIIPRRLEFAASASLKNLVKGMSLVDGKYFYGTGDKAVLEIDVVDSSVLQMTQISLFNSGLPRVSKDLRAEPRFRTSESVQATKFVVEFLPASIRNEAAFYRNGPHGINVSFLVNGLGRRAAEEGHATVSGMNVEDPGEDEPAAADGDAAAQPASGLRAASKSNAAPVAGVAIACVVLAVGAIAAVSVRAYKKRERLSKEASAVEL